MASLVSATLAANTNALTLIPSEDVVLSKRDEAIVAERACGTDRAADMVRAWRYIDERPRLHVEVTCAPHGKISGYAALKIAERPQPG